MTTKATRQGADKNGSKQGVGVCLKRPAEPHADSKIPLKRAVLGDITNPAPAVGERGKPCRHSLRCRKPATVKLEASPKVEPEEKTAIPQPPLPEGVADFDIESKDDPFAESTYAADIFRYYKEREVRFRTAPYLERQPELSAAMRAILVDWMVEVQENFELNHETLYLGVKMVDRYLSLAPTPKTQLQLVGATALFLACKFDERLPPAVQDFLYICDDAYSRQELLAMEITMLKVLDFELGLPVSYRFLRRYARCAHLALETLTLARFVLESSLLDYALVDRPESLLAAAALLQALRMKGMAWSAALEHWTGYDESELEELQKHLNQLLTTQQTGNLEAIRCKYSHTVFFQVALTPLLPL
ncbi:G2/mitotic-specific cyclin A, putative [Ixodes scapularis]|uniref:G2/mitotic-specific cyclin A, putative n=1 Tax=Ixodes scapularis TaxID=6945 RepID=B7PSN4_IXOSC|nr:G2/mitotic-specific cyclin A, putative [Ixodes scapularis]|eukprot:XP_002402768.1 G2/mitotic-specific cyclin A, putative [Ixodes scapularis]